MSDLENQKITENSFVEKENLFEKFKSSRKMQIIFVGIIILLIIIVMVGMKISNDKKNEELLDNFYSTMEESVDAIDIIADEIYNCWYDSIYKDKYNNSIDYAIECAFDNKRSKVRLVIQNDDVLSDLLDEIEDSNIKEKHPEIYEAVIDLYDSYTDYYEFTINVSGSFNSYSAKKEDIKKDTRSYLNKLERRL